MMALPHESSNPPPVTASRPALWAAVAMLVFVLIWLDSAYGGLRFASPILNHIAAVAVCLLPLAAVLCVLKCRPSWRRTLVVLLLVPVVALSLLAFVFLCRVPADALVAYRTVQVGRSAVRAYRSSTGAFSSFDTTVVEERPIVPGLVWVRPLHFQHSAHDVRIEVLDRHHVRLSYPWHPLNDPKPVRVIVRIAG